MFYPLPLFVGLRYTRAKRRTHFISFISFTSAIGIALGVTILITVLSVMNGFHKEVRERILGMVSHADIRSASGGLANWRWAVAKAKADARVVGAAPYVEGQVMLVRGQQVSGALLRGVLPKLEPEVVDVAKHMLVGSLADLEPGKYRIILGKELADILGVGVGDAVTVVTPQTTVTPTGTIPRLKRFTVSGIFEVDMGDFDRGVAMVHMRDAAKLQRLGDQVSGVRLKLENLFEAGAVSRELANEYGGRFRVLSWMDYHRNFFAALKMEKRMMGVLLFFVVAIAAFNIVATLVMVVMDKQSDIAILKTLGATPRQVLWIFIVQGSVIGVVGTLAGAIGGVLLALNIEQIVAILESWFGIHFIDPDVYYISKLPSDLQWRDVLMVSGGALLWSLLMTFYPAWRALRTQPAEALRYE